MDYLTRRAIAARGSLGVRLAGLHGLRWPRLSSLGIRIDSDPELFYSQVCVDELRQALTDIGEQIELPTAEYASADSLEALLVRFTPYELDNRIYSFLRQLHEEAEQQICLFRNLPDVFQEPFRLWLGKNVIRIEGGAEGYRQSDLDSWMDELRSKDASAAPHHKVHRRGK